MQRTYQPSLTAVEAPLSYVRSPGQAPASGKLPFRLLLLFLLLFYANPTVFVPAVEVFRPTQVVAILAIALLVLERTLSGRGLTLIWPESHLLLAFFAVAGLSCLTALWMDWAVARTIDLGRMVVVSLLIVNCVDSWDRLRTLIWTMVLGGLVPAIGTIFHYTQGVLVEGSRAAWYGVFANPNELAFGLVTLLPLAVYLTSESRFRGKTLLWMVVAVYAAAIYVSFSRGGVLGLAAVLLVLGFRHPSWSARLLTLVLLVAGCIGVFYFWSRPEGFGDLSQDTTVQQRVETIKAGWAMFLDHPLLGVGLDCSIVAFPLYAEPGSLSKGGLINHNMFIQALGETGAPGFLLFMGFLGAGLYHAGRLARRRRMDDGGRSARLGASLDASLWGVLACGLSGGYIVTWFPYLVLALIAAGTRVAEMDPLAAGDQ